MAKYEAKTKEQTTSVESFIDQIEDEQIRDDCRELVRMMEKASGHKGKIWGSGIVGFGKYHYKYDSGHEGDSCLTGFAPRKGNIAIYTNLRLEDSESLMNKLGKYKNGKSCINIKKMDDVDKKILYELIDTGVKGMLKKYPGSK